MHFQKLLVQPANKRLSEVMARVCEKITTLRYLIEWDTDRQGDSASVFCTVILLKVKRDRGILSFFFDFYAQSVEFYGYIRFP